MRMNLRIKMRMKKERGDVNEIRNGGMNENGNGGMNENGNGN